MKIFLVAGELSGDQLGFKLMQALRRALGETGQFAGLGGPAMAAEGLRSLFPLRDIAVMGLVPVIRKLPQIMRRIRQTADAAIAWRPDVLVIIDSPDFTHRVARRVRKALPQLPVVDYVSPSVWAWRPGRARAMTEYVDRVLALLPFEPDAHRRLGGPYCVYVGHPLVERLRELRPNQAERQRRESAPPHVLILPGSRRHEIERLLDDFGAAAQDVESRFGPIDWVIPAVESLEGLIRDKVANWTLKPRILCGEADKYAAFRSARAALAASGTVTLELSLAGVPTVVAYKVPMAEELLRPLVRVSSIVLPNLVLGENAVPEFIQRDCAPGALAAALLPLLREGPERRAQIAAFSLLDERMRTTNGEPPSEVAARNVLEAVAQGRLRATR